MRASVSIWLVLFCVGCASPIRQHVDPAFDTTQVSKIGLDVAMESLDSQPLISKISSERIAQGISERFLNAGYPVYPLTASPGDARSRAFSHVLKVRAEGLQTKSTPPGFTLSMGDSDPRSQDFQRAKVIPITCSLQTSGRGEVASRTEDYAAHQGWLQASSLEDPGSEQRRVAFFIDNMGATCHELLTALKILPVQARSPESQTSEKPAVRIETFDEADPPQTPSGPPADPASDRHSLVDQKSRLPTLVVPGAGRSASGATGPPEIRKPSTVRVEQETSGSVFRKQIKIFNKGDTVILKFGHERQ
jgi:hypothetical protein